MCLLRGNDVPLGMFPKRPALAAPCTRGVDGLGAGGGPASPGQEPPGRPCLQSRGEARPCDRVVTGPWLGCPRAAAAAEGSLGRRACGVAVPLRVWTEDAGGEK